MKQLLFGAVALGMMLTACQKKTEMTSGIYLENLDQTAVCGNDFYQYACGGWMKNNPLSGEYARFGSFDKLAENNRKQLKDLIDGIVAANNEKGSNAQKVADIYNLVMDTCAATRKVSNRFSHC